MSTMSQVLKQLAGYASHYLLRSPKLKVNQNGHLHASLNAYTKLGPGQVKG